MIFKDIEIKVKTKEEYITKILTFFNAFSTNRLTPTELRIMAKALMTNKDVKQPMLGASGGAMRDDFGFSKTQWEQHKYNMRQKGVFG